MAFGDIFIIIYSILIFLLFINTILMNKIDNITMYKDIELNYYSTKIVLLYIFLGIFLFFFKKRIKEYRKQIYMINCIKIYEWEQKAWPLIISLNEHKKYKLYKRYLKLKKLKK